MQIAKPVGREAASRKYDILSALMAFALSQDKTQQRQILRLMSLITTRYNWQNDELSMGQDDIARLWSVDTRTVKREMAKLRAKGWLVLKRQGARGRVSLYGLDLSLILGDTRDTWDNIGSDFVARMSPEKPSAEPGQSNVVPLRAPRQAPVSDGSFWASVQQELHGQDPSVYAAWFEALHEAGRDEGRLHIAAPTRFHATYVKTHLKNRLLAVARRFDPTLSDIEISA